MDVTFHSLNKFAVKDPPVICQLTATSEIGVGFVRTTVVEYLAPGGQMSVPNVRMGSFDSQATAASCSVSGVVRADAPPELAAPPQTKPGPKPTNRQAEAGFDATVDAPSERSSVRTAVEPPARNVIRPTGPLTAAHLLAIKRHIQSCWLMPVGVRQIEGPPPTVRVHMNQDGTRHTAVLVNAERNFDPSFRKVAESALRALRNRSCQPLQLRADDYAAWRVFTIDPRDVP